MTATDIKYLMEKRASFSMSEALGGANLGQVGYDVGVMGGDTAGALIAKIPAAIALKKGHPNLARRLALAGVHIGSKIGDKFSRKLHK